MRWFGVINKQFTFSLHLAQKYAWVFVRRHNLFGDANSFPRAKLEEYCELRGTDNIRGQIYEHTFRQNGGYCFYYSSISFCNVRLKCLRVSYCL